MPKALHRWATSVPMRPSPSTPRVLPYSSMPDHFERSQDPATSAPWAWGMLRARAQISATVCSAAEMMLDCGALQTITPCRVAASTSTLSSPTPARAITLRLRRRRDHVGVDRGGRPHDDAVVVDDRLEQLVLGQPGPHVDVVVLGQGGDTGLGQLVGDEDAHGRTFVDREWEVVATEGTTPPTAPDTGTRQTVRNVRTMVAQVVGRPPSPGSSLTICGVAWTT